MRHATQIRETLANLRMRARRGWELVIIWIVVQWTGGGKQFVRRAGGSGRGLLPKSAVVGRAAPRAPSPELEKHCPSLKIERPARAERRALPFRGCRRFGQHTQDTLPYPEDRSPSKWCVCES